MSRQNLSTTEKELYENWQLCRRKSHLCKGKMSEGAIIQKEWETFEGFVKDNWFRYLRAKLKWKNYARVVNRVDGKNNLTGNLKLRNTRLTRKVKALGFTKSNTVYTSPSDAMKYHTTTHKYMFENQLLGTRDIKNILKKRGVILTMEGIVRRLSNGISLFDPSERYHQLFKGVYRSYVEIAEMENISYDLLKKRITKDNMTFDQALSYCINFREQKNKEL